MDIALDVYTPARIIAVALVAGMVAQSLAYQLRLPGILILLLFGAILGPDGFGIVKPAALGDVLPVLTGFAIAVILFEAGMNLEWKQLRTETLPIRLLVSLGAMVTWVAGSLAAALILGWDSRDAILFGSLVIAGGPSVVSPLLRRIRVRRNLQTTLESEAVFIEAIGIMIAVLAFEFAFAQSGESALGVLRRLAIGASLGIAGAGVMLLLLRSRRLIPAGMEKVFTLTLAWGTFVASNEIAPGSGILAAVVAGVMASNIGRENVLGVRETKESLTAVLLGMLIVMLAAQARMSEVVVLGAHGLAVVAVLMFVARPLCVLSCTVSAGLSWREKAFLSWISPRGVVAASLAILCYQGMLSRGLEGGESLRALVLLVIVSTVLVQGLTGSVVAGWLGVKRPRGQGYVILGANPLAVELARVLKQGGEESTLIDANPSLCSEVEAKGFRVLHGNALDERILTRAEIETRKAIIALLPNDGVNLMFARRAVDEYRADRVYVAMHGGAIKPAHIAELRGRILFGSPADVDQWASRLGRGEALVEKWSFMGVPDPRSNPTMPVPKESRVLVMPIALARGTTVRPIDDRYEPKKSDVVTWLLFTRREEDARGWLRGRGWSENSSA